MSRKEKQTFDTEKEPFPSNLRKLLEERKVSQAALAEYLGITRQAVSLYATGQSYPDIKTFNKITEFFIVSADFMLGKTKIMTTDEYVRFVSEYTGLDEDAVSFLDEINELMAENINILSILIKDLKYSSKHQAILELIAQYFNFQSNTKKYYTLDKDGVIEEYVPEIRKGIAYISHDLIVLTPEILEKSILLKIESALSDLRKKYVSKKNEDSSSQE